MAMPPPAPGTPILGWVDNGQPARVQLDPVGHTHPGHHLWHENASGGGSQLSPGGHCGGFKPVREDDPGEILSPWLWSWQNV